MKFAAFVFVAVFGLGFISGYYSHILRLKYLRAKRNYFERKVKETKEQLQRF